MNCCMRCSFYKVTMRFNNKLKVLDSKGLYCLLSSSKNNKKKMEKMKKQVSDFIVEAKRDYYWDDLPLYNFEPKIKRDKASKIQIREAEEIAERIAGVESLQSNINYDPDMLMILPESVAIDSDDFKTPFPFTIEAPIFNTDVNHEEIVTYLLKKEDNLDADEQMVI